VWVSPAAGAPTVAAVGPAPGDRSLVPG
jgi:hypothetical protein